MKMSAIFVIAALLTGSTVPAVAQDVQEQALCNISAETCRNLVDNLQKRIRKINAEIRKGNKKYSADDMKKLEQKLKDAMEQLDRMEAKPSKQMSP